MPVINKMKKSSS